MGFDARDHPHDTKAAAPSCRQPFHSALPEIPGGAPLGRNCRRSIRTRADGYNVPNGQGRTTATPSATTSRGCSRVARTV